MPALAADPQTGSSLLSFLPLVLIIAAVYFLMIRPQSKRRQQAKSMQSSIGPGDEIVTIGGLYAHVVEIDDETVTLEISPNTYARYARGAIARVVPPKEDDVPADPDNSDAEKAIEQG